MYYAYIIENNISGIVESWEECKKITNSKKARYKKFKTYSEAESWLKNGALYDKKISNINLDKNAVYFDAGTGRGIGVEVRVSDYKKLSLLNKVLKKEKINEFGNLTLGMNVTNNYGELVGLYLAIKYCIKYNVTTIYGDSDLVIKYWSKGICNKENLNKKTIELIEITSKLLKDFINNKNGKLLKISGDDNPADLGFHK